MAPLDYVGWNYIGPRCLPANERFVHAGGPEETKKTRACLSSCPCLSQQLFLFSHPFPRSPAFYPVRSLRLLFAIRHRSPHPALCHQSARACATPTAPPSPACLESSNRCPHHLQYPSNAVHVRTGVSRSSPIISSHLSLRQPQLALGRCLNRIFRRLPATPLLKSSDSDSGTSRGDQISGMVSSSWLAARRYSPRASHCVRPNLEQKDRISPPQTQLRDGLEAAKFEVCGLDWDGHGKAGGVARRDMPPTHCFANRSCFDRT